MRTAWSSILIAACAAACTDGDLIATDDSLEADDRVAQGRVVYGRVHDVDDQNLGLPDIPVRLGDVQTTSDLTGQYRLEAPLTENVLLVDADAADYTPLAVHLPDVAEQVEYWPGVLTLDQSQLVLDFMAASSDVTPRLLDDWGYLVVSVRLYGATASDPEGAEVQVDIDGLPAEDVYVNTWNEVLEECLPSRVGAATARPEERCGGVVLVPEIAPTAQVAVTLTHDRRLCARSTEERDAGEVSDTIDATLQLVPGRLNVVEIECEKAVE